MDSTLRFSNRVENYVRYRPSYPAAAFDLMEENCGLKQGARVADIGAGTGISAELLLDRGAAVYGVEPNAEMRAAMEAQLGKHPNFVSVAEPAEDTGLADHSLDMVLAAQAFHWFDKPLFREECLRILKPEGYAVLMWNNRQSSTTFLRDYEEFLRNLGTDYVRVDHNQVKEEHFREFYGSGGYHLDKFPNEQVFGWEGFLGRVESSSYTPSADHPDHEPMVAGLREVYERHQVDAMVKFDYVTEVYWGRVA